MEIVHTIKLYRKNVRFKWEIIFPYRLNEGDTIYGEFFELPDIKKNMVCESSANDKPVEVDFSIGESGIFVVDYISINPDKSLEVVIKETD